MKGLLTDFKDKRITGVNINNKITNEQYNLYADFIVDASGRQTLCPEWLETLGYEKPACTEVNLDIHYMSQLFQLDKNYSPSFKIFIIRDIPPIKKWGVMTRIEDDHGNKRLLVTLGAKQSDRPDISDEGFRQFAQQLPYPDIYNAITNGKPLTPVTPFYFPSIRRYHYEQIQCPANFIAIGDASCSLSPTYGIGMTVSAINAEILNKTLEKHVKTDFSHSNALYFKAISKVLDSIWKNSVKPDLLNQIPENQWPMLTKLNYWYRKSLLELCTNDVELWKQINLILKSENQRTLYHPSYLLRVLFNAIKNK